MYSNRNLRELEMPKLEEAGEIFLHYNKCLTKLEVPNMPGLKKEFSYMICENLKKEEAKNKKKIYLEKNN